MQAFKFLDQKDVPLMLSGSFRFGRLRNYQLLEMVYGDREIGDRREGASALHAHAKGLTISNQIDCFALCLSLGTPDVFAGTYDGCVSINDVGRLARVIFAHGQIDGRPFTSVFRDLACDAVTYDWVETDLAHTDDASPSPFRKSPRFARQAEVRIAVVHREPIEADSITVRCHPRRVARLLEEVPVKAVGEAPAWPARRSEETNVRTIWAICTERGTTRAALWEGATNFDERHRRELCRCIFETDALRGPIIDGLMARGTKGSLILKLLQLNSRLFALFAKYGLEVQAQYRSL
ncbi:MAG TPA: hypothetical protein VHQ87_17640 [Rhizobacter sp.]|nr:hypothetical protein [Rhizobacter sp.]